MIYFSDTHKGIIMMIAGIVLLLHTLGILQQWLSFFLIAGSLYMIGYGFYKSGYTSQLLALLNKK